MEQSFAEDEDFEAAGSQDDPDDLETIADLPFEEEGDEPRD
jgi:hypothetical protein